MKNETIAIIGGGNMGASIIAGLIHAGYSPEKIWVSNSNAEKLAVLQKKFLVHGTHDNNEAAKQADVVILAVKPVVMKQVAQELAATIQRKKACVISVATGIRIAALQQWLGNSVAIIRTMPNLPAIIGCGVTAMFASAAVNAAQREMAEHILRSIGVVVWVEHENLLDVVTAISGSGPAYFFYFMELIQSAAEELGLSKELAEMLTLNTAYGAARLALESNDHVAELRKRVTSKGGTTEQAITILESSGIRDIFSKALKAAHQRAVEFGERNG